MATIRQKIGQQQRKIKYNTKRLNSLGKEVQNLLNNVYGSFSDLSQIITDRIIEAVRDKYLNEQDFYGGESWRTKAQSRVESYYRQSQEEQGKYRIMVDTGDLEKNVQQALFRRIKVLKGKNVDFEIIDGIDWNALPKSKSSGANYGKLHQQGRTKAGTVYQILPTESDLKEFYQKGDAAVFGGKGVLGGLNVDNEIEKIYDKFLKEFEKITCDIDELKL